VTVAAASEPGLAAAPPRRRWLRRIPWVILPLLVFLAVFFLWPVVQLLTLSGLDPRGAASLVHYTRLFGSPVYLQVLAITFKIAFWTTVLTLLGAYPVAYFLATATARTRGLLVLAVLLPFWTSFLVRTIAWIVLLGRKGAINNLLAAAGIVDAPLALVFNLTGVLVGMSHALMPLAVLTMLAVMQGIPNDLVRAAGTLGGRGGQVFWRIYFPLSLPGVAASGLMVFITALGFFITPALLGGRRETMITQVIIEQVQTLLNWGFAGAISMLLLVAALLIFVLYDRLLGMSTLVGGDPRAGGNDSGSDPGGAIARLGNRLGALLLAGLGGGCDRVMTLWDRLFPPRAGRPPRGRSRRVLAIGASALLAFLALPTLFVVPISFTEHAFIEWPPAGFSLRWYAQYFGSPVWLAATLRSLAVGVVTALAATLIATPAAFVLVRRPLYGGTALLAFLLSPMILPRMIIAVALFYLYARIGLVGTSLGLVIGHTVLAIPYVVITVMAVLKGYDERLDQAAATLGASPLRTLARVTLPLIRPGLISAAIFAFIVSFDELTIALFVTGGLSVTLPRQMWDDALLRVSPALAAVSTLMLIFVSVMILAAEWLRRRSEHVG
jgi:putative spermidine/putrescine transport system permease protein